MVAVFICMGMIEVALIYVATLLNSGDKMSQNCLYNSASSPSGPGDLFFGILFKALPSSSELRGVSKMFACSVVSVGKSRLFRKVSISD